MKPVVAPMAVEGGEETIVNSRVNLDDAVEWLEFSFPKRATRTAATTNAEKLRFTDGSIVTQTAPRPVMAIDAVRTFHETSLSPVHKGAWAALPSRDLFLSMLDELADTGYIRNPVSPPNIPFHEDGAYTYAFRFGEETVYDVKHHGRGMGRVVPFTLELPGHFFVAQRTTYLKELRRIEQRDDEIVDYEKMILRDMVRVRLKDAGMELTGDVSDREIGALPLFRTPGGLYVPKPGDGILRAEDGGLAFMVLRYTDMYKQFVGVQQAFMFKNGSTTYDVLPPISAQKPAWPNPNMVVNFG